MSFIIFISSSNIFMIFIVYVHIVVKSC
jgi:hypothetical protein